MGVGRFGEMTHLYVASAIQAKKGSERRRGVLRRTSLAAHLDGHLVGIARNGGA